MATRIGKLETVTNQGKVAQASDTYLCVWVKNQAGKFPLLLTEAELSNAIHRAKKNPEDITKLSLISKILD